MATFAFTACSPVTRDASRGSLRSSVCMSNDTGFAEGDGGVSVSLGAFAMETLSLVWIDG